MILFNSDYLEGAHPRIMQRLMETNMVQTTGYGEDEYCAQARETVRRVCEAVSYTHLTLPTKLEV